MMPDSFPSLTAAMLRRLAGACQQHLHDSALAHQLEVVAQGEDARASGGAPLSRREATALAATLERYLCMADDPSVSSNDRQRLAPLRELMGQVAAALGQELRRAWADRVRGLYVIVDPARAGGHDVLALARAALDGGATAIQLRDKDHDKGDVLPVAQQLVHLCRQYDAVCIINDHADLAVACGAHGLHVGQHDLPVAEARKVLHPWQFVGRSNALLKEAMESYRQGADYIAVGAMYTSSSKEKTRPAGVETLRRVRDAIPRDGPPLVAIGGITEDRVAEVVRAGADGVCVIGAIAQADDPLRAARQLVARIREAQASR